jgi:hypothetical protein
LPKAAQPWSLTSLREKLIRIGAKVVSHVWFKMAEVAVPRQMFAEILSLIGRLRAPPAPPRDARGVRPGKGEERGMSGANKRGTFGVSLLSTTGVNRLLPAATAICPCPSRSQA